MLCSWGSELSSGSYPRSRLALLLKVCETLENDELTMLRVFWKKPLSSAGLIRPSLYELYALESSGTGGSQILCSMRKLASPAYRAGFHLHFLAFIDVKPGHVSEFFHVEDDASLLPPAFADHPAKRDARYIIPSNQRRVSLLGEKQDLPRLWRVLLSTEPPPTSVRTCKRSVGSSEVTTYLCAHPRTTPPGHLFRMLDCQSWPLLNRCLMKRCVISANRSAHHWMKPQSLSRRRMYLSSPHNDSSLEQTWRDARPTQVRGGSIE